MAGVRSPAPPLSAWRFVVGFGVISLFADMVYEGARSVTGPFLAHLGASVGLVGLITGVGEAAALVLRLVSGPLADSTGRFWAWTVAGYALSMIAVPLLGLTGVLWVAVVLVLTERVGKAVRSPAKDTVLSFAAATAGRGRGFAVHEAMDQVGAFIGPLLVASVLAFTHNHFQVAFGLMAAPAVVVLGLLAWLRARVPDPADYEAAPMVETARERTEPAPAEPVALPATFWRYSAFTAATMAGFATFGVLSFHMAERRLLPAAAVPVVYAGAMAVGAVAALAAGWAYDRLGPRVLTVLPVLAAAVPMLAFGSWVPGIVVGALVWGAAVGVHESTMRAVVADLVGPSRRATAYGRYAAVVGVATAVGGVLTGFLYGVSVPLLVGVVVTIQAVAMAALLFPGFRRRGATAR